MKRLRSLSTVNEVIIALGDNAGAAEITRRGVTAVCNWRAANRLPARSYLVITEALKQRGYCAPASLWEMDEPPKTVAAE